MLQPQPQNRYPDCLYLKITGKPKPNASSQVDLYLTINFNEHWEKIFGGRIKWGLKGGELRLRLTNGVMPYESRELTGLLTLAVQKKRVEQANRKVQTGIEAQVGDLAIVPAVVGQAEVKTSIETEQTQGVVEEFQFTDCQITTKGSEENPAWVFAAPTGELVLKGLLKRTKLGTLHLQARPCLVEATFEVTRGDIYLTDAEGLWSPDISRNRRAVIERAIALHLLEPKFKPFLSSLKLQFD